MSRCHLEAIIGGIARRLPEERLRKLYATACAIEREDPADLRQGESERTARARARQAEVERWRAGGRIIEAEKAEREP